MKANNSFLLLLLWSFLGITNAAAQGPKPCGSYKINKVALQKALDYEKLHPGFQPTASTLLRVYFHICACNDGSLPATTPDEINGEEFNTLVTDYASDNICFLNAGVNYVYDSKLDTNFNANTDDESLFDPYTIPLCINIFYVQNIEGANGNCNCGIGGFTFDSPGTRCLIASGNVGEGHTISHETGHCLGLLHTFDTGYGDEDINGDNASSAGDLITDTPADPFAYNGQSCFSNSGCLYTGNCEDPNNQTNFSPPYTNIMAYWWASGCDANVLTSGQYTRVNSFLSSNDDLSLCESPQNFTEGPILNISLGYLMFSAVDQLNTTGTVTVTGTGNVTFGGSTVLLEPGFDAAPSTGGLFLARTSACSSEQPGAQHRADDKDAERNNPILFQINPNPTEGIAFLSFTTDEAFNLQIQVTDITGRIMNSFSRVANEGVNKIYVDLSSYDAGVYYVNVHSDEGNRFSLKVVRQ